MESMTVTLTMGFNKRKAFPGMEEPPSELEVTGVVQVPGLVIGPGVAVTPKVTSRKVSPRKKGQAPYAYDVDDSGAAWVITHIPSGRKLVDRIYGTLDRAMKAGKAVSALRDWSVDMEDLTGKDGWEALYAADKAVRG